MKMHYSLDETNHICSLSIEGESPEMDLPDDFDFTQQSLYAINDGALTIDTARQEEFIQQQSAYAVTNQINALIAKLHKYDYIGTKIATGCATKDEYAEQIAQMEVWRQGIRDLGG
jgi:hypothetical protein